MKTCLAIDIGASSGRAIVGWYENGAIETEEVYRFPNGMTESGGHLTWDIDALFESVVAGIGAAFAKYPHIDSLSIDTWGVDYVLLRGEETVYPVYAYRDGRTEEPIEKVHAILSPERLFAKTGIMFQPFNTVYQLYADLGAGRLAGVSDFLMIPEYLMYRLTGVKKKEYTNATTTGMVNAATGEFDPEIVSALGLPAGLFPTLSAPGTPVGDLLPEIAARVGGQTKVLLCATHDTGSAVEGIPMKENAPYISSGTWSLLGIKSERPHTDEGSRKALYSNEGGVGYVRFQTNIMGLWIVQSLKKELCPDTSFGEIADMAQTSSFKGLFDVNDPRFLAPASMKAAIDSVFAGGKDKPAEPKDYFNTAYRSLAAGYDHAIREMENTLGETFRFIYIVGGGAKNAYLNALTEQFCHKKVVAYPIEATAIGNLKIQLESEI